MIDTKSSQSGAPGVSNSLILIHLISNVLYLCDTFDVFVIKNGQGILHMFSASCSLFARCTTFSSS